MSWFVYIWSSRVLHAVLVFCMMSDKPYTGRVCRHISSCMGTQLENKIADGTDFQLRCNYEYASSIGWRMWRIAALGTVRCRITTPRINNCLTGVGCLQRNATRCSGNHIKAAMIWPPFVGQKTKCERR